jgi:hypothetical protein
MEKAREYEAYAVFFRTEGAGRSPVAEAFVYLANEPEDPTFGEMHRRLWSWGGVPLVYRKARGLVQLFRCGHKPDFVSRSGDIICRPAKTLDLLASISASLAEPWWDALRLRNGSLWDEPGVCDELLSSHKAASRSLISRVSSLSEELRASGVLPKRLRRRLLILSLLIAYLEDREVLEASFFGEFLPGAEHFFQVLGDGKALVDLLAELKKRFNGNVFSLSEDDRQALRNSSQLEKFAKLVHGREDKHGQLTLWKLYSFRDLPVELISHIYQLFVKDTASSVYTPPFLVRLMLEESLSWDRLAKISDDGELIVDPCCGSGVFLVEAYKRMILHWRSVNGWSQPTPEDLRKLLQRLHGVDLEEGAIELAAFSLCLALCDALPTEVIRSAMAADDADDEKLFPKLIGKTLHKSCFFDFKTSGGFTAPVGVVMGNPPFASKLDTDGALASHNRYVEEHGALPDKQLAYLFLHESAGLLKDGGILCMLQQYNFLYNQHSRGFRVSFFKQWDVREILDFVSIRGLFQKGDADTKVIVVLAEATKPPPDRQILHATFRRTGRADAEQGFDIDYYDLHWLARELILATDSVWRCDLLGGGRVLNLVDRLKKTRTLGGYATGRKWDCGEGFIEAESGTRTPAKHVTGEPLLPSDGIGDDGIKRDRITTVETKLFRSAYLPSRYTPPMLLVHEHADLHHDVWTEHYLTYKNQIVGFCAPPEHQGDLEKIAEWMANEKTALKAFVAATSVKLFTQHATTLSGVDVQSLPYPEHGLDLSVNERILTEDIVLYMRDLIRLGETSAAMRSAVYPRERHSSSSGTVPQSKPRSKPKAKLLDLSKELDWSNLDAFADVYFRQLNTVYKNLRALRPQLWEGIVCQPFVFGKGEVDWDGMDELRSRLDAILVEKRGTSLRITRIARVYDDVFIFMLKPNRLRYWLRSVALRDADETIVDLRRQGF